MYNFAPMNRKNLLFVAGASLIFLAACQSPKDQIVRKWQVEGIESATRDSMFKVQEKSIDTITVIDSNMAMFMGTTNVDSFKTMAKAKMAESKTEQENQMKQISMNFLKDGIMIQEGGGRADSLKWVLTEDGKQLLLSALNPPAGMPNRTDTLHVDKISASNLRFKVVNPQGNLFINLKAAGETKAEDKKAEEKK